MEWESFARIVWPKGATVEPAELRDHAADILRATAVDMQSDQSGRQQADKSRGAGSGEGDWDDLTRASSSHGSGRVVSGFELAAGFQYHLPKPVDPHDLTAVIAKLAERSR